MPAFECTGQWWLPEDDARRAAGTLKVSPSGALRLWLVGALGQVSLFQSKSHPVILGWVDNSPAGDVVTLRGCALGGSTVGPANIARENYHAACRFFRAHLHRPADFAFKSMTLRLAGLSEWSHGYTGFVGGTFPAGAGGGATPQDTNTRLRSWQRRPAAVCRSGWRSLRTRLTGSVSSGRPSA